MQPERARGWLDTILPLLREGGPIVSLVLLLLGGVTIWWLMHALDRSQTISLTLYNKLITCFDRQMEIARDCRKE